MYKSYLRPGAKNKKSFYRKYPYRGKKKRLFPNLPPYVRYLYSNASHMQTVSPGLNTFSVVMDVDCGNDPWISGCTLDFVVSSTSFIPYQVTAFVIDTLGRKLENGIVGGLPACFAKTVSDEKLEGFHPGIDSTRSRYEKVFF